MHCGCVSFFAQLYNCERANFIAWRFAPSITTPIGTPCPSVSTLRFTPLLPRSVGLGPVFSPPSGADAAWPHPCSASPNRAHTIHQIAQLPPAKAVPEDACFHPFLKPAVCCRMRTEIGLVESLPLTTSSQDIKDRVRTAAIGSARTPEAFAMRVHMQREQRLQHRPQLIADPKTGRGPIIWRPLTTPFLWFLFAHASHSSTPADPMTEAS
jgi:hypothetical protein